MALLLVCIGTPAVATEQIPDVIVMDGVEHPLHSEPFSPVLDQPAMWQLFREAAQLERGPCTANWRGYRAWWRLHEGALWLEHMVYGACSDKPPSADLSLYFPGRKPSLLADWFSGVLVVPLGPAGENSHMGYSTEYPRYRLIKVQNGKAVDEREIDHAQLLELRRRRAPSPALSKNDDS